MITILKSADAHELEKDGVKNKMENYKVANPKLKIAMKKDAI
ncbi:hypothetical protein [Priestia megaterium]|nr:hypothetical protein [Priestia megaterium]MDH3183739.1 hypothetical protein [Priestia megaterium]